MHVTQNGYDQKLEKSAPTNFPVTFHTKSCGYELPLNGTSAKLPEHQYTAHEIKFNCTMTTCTTQPSVQQCSQHRLLERVGHSIVGRCMVTLASVDRCWQESWSLNRWSLLVVVGKSLILPVDVVGKSLGHAIVDERIDLGTGTVGQQ